jgi:hypothetical protein
LISEVPGLSISAKKKKQPSKQADHFSALAPAYERIKAQLERRKKLQKRVRQPEAGDDTGNDKRGLAVDQQSGGGKNDEEGSREADTRRRDPAYEKKKAAVKWALKKHRKAAEIAKERQRLQEELDEAELNLQWAMDNCFNESEEEKGNERLEEDEGGAGGGGSVERRKISSQREVHHERVEVVASQRRSQKMECSSPDSETESESEEAASSVTESESEKDMPPAQQSLGKKKVS